MTRPVGLSPAVANIHTYNQKSTLILRYILCTIVHCIKCLWNNCIDATGKFITLGTRLIMHANLIPLTTNNSEDDSDLDYVDENTYE